MICSDSTGHAHIFKGNFVLNPKLHNNGNIYAIYYQLKSNETKFWQK